MAVMSVEQMLGEAYAKIAELERERNEAKRQLEELRDTMRQALVSVLVDVSATKRALSDMAASWKTVDPLDDRRG